jgi:hypothetical protein
MFKPGVKVIITGRQFTGQKGVIIRRDKLAIPGESSQEVWAVKLESGVNYKFYEECLKLDEDESA